MRPARENLRDRLRTGLSGHTQAGGQELDCACVVVSQGDDVMGTGLSSNMFNHDEFFIAHSL